MKNSMATVLEQFTVGGNLDVSDVLSVVVSRAEQHYSVEINRCKAAIAANEKEQTELVKEINERAEEERCRPFQAQVNALNAALVPLGGKAKFENNKHCLVATDGMLSVVINIHGDNSGYTASIAKKVKPSKRLLSDVAKVAELKVKVQVLQEEALSWRRKLSNVPMLERQYRAKIAEAKLGTTDSGRKLMDLLTGDLDQAILALPG